MENKTKEKEKSGIFDAFTNQYALSKTLRFELRPSENTKNFLKEHKVFEKDKVIHESYIKAKPYFDQIHREFIEEALNPDRAKSLSFTSFEKFLFLYQEDKKAGRQGFEGAKKDTYRAVVKLLNDHADSWKRVYAPEAKQSGTELLCSSEILPVLKARFPSKNKEESLFIQDEKGDQRYIFDSFDGFTTYLGKFQETRKNLYKDDGTSTAVATRVAENLVFFLDNKRKFEKYIAHAKELTLKSEEINACKPSNYPNCMIQRGIETYNNLVGELNARMKRLRDQAGKDAKKSEYPLLKKLYSQILAEKKIEIDEVSIEKMEDVLPAFHNFYQETMRLIGGASKLMRDLSNSTIYSGEYMGIYLHNRAINTIARRWFISAYEFENALPSKGKTKDGAVKVSAFVSLEDIERALAEKNTEDTLKEGIIEEFNLDKRASAFSQFLIIFIKEIEKLGAVYKEKYKVFSALNLKLFDRGKKDIHVDALKEVLECGLNIVQFVKYFALSSKKSEDKPASISNEFYNRYDEIYGDPDAKHMIVCYHDAFRNFLTKKPDAKDKIKLNFENGALLSGFDKNKESEKLGIILRRGDRYYLGIINKDHNKIFDDAIHKDIFDISGGDAYEKMEYKLFPDPKRMIPHIAFGKNLEKLKKFGWTQEIQDIKNEFAKFQESKQENSENWSKKFDAKKLSVLIEYYQQALEIGGYKKTFKFEWKNPSAYATLGDFNNDVAKKNYRVDFRKVSWNYVEKRVALGELYLFEIYGKDFSEYTSGIKNIHTLYFLNLFSGLNLQNPVLRLAGNAEIFCRVPSVKKQSEKRNFIRPITPYKRFTEQKYFFHIPIQINASVGKAARKKLNISLNKKLASDGGINIIGIDRGEKHLAYYSVINRNGKIIDSGSFNKINGVDYFEMLRTRAKERIEQRRSWKVISQIKDLKRGYISQVVYQLAELVIKHNAVIVFEDLNLRFKEIRGGVEQSVYQQLEKAVIEKFSYLVFKKREARALGGVLNGYQLATPVQSFEEMNRQNGIIFYVNPEYTSITDPITGWRQHIYLSSSANDGALLEAFTKKIQIGWDEMKRSYTFAYNQKDYARDKDAVSHEWVLYADMSRIDRYRNEDGYWEAHKINPNDLLKELFLVWKFPQLEGDMSEQIAIMYADKALQGEREVNGKSQRFFKALRYFLNMVQQIRNSDSVRYVPDRDKEGNIKEDKDNKWLVKKTGDDIDFLASPVKPFFATPSKYSKENLCGLKIENGDANGAYNIARKGMIALERIHKNTEKPDLYISRYDWDKYTQTQNHS